MASEIWTYSGETAKALDATVRPFDVEGAKFTRPALDAEIMEWTVPLKDLVPGDERVPEDKQLVTFYRDGERFFRGHAMRPRRVGLNMLVRVAGPWFWLEKIMLTSAVALGAASGGGTGERATIGFPAQSMTTSLGALFDRAIALGVPMVKGSIAATFACIPVTLNHGSCGRSIADCVRMIGDLALCFDHTQTGLPVLNVRRRLSGLGSGTCPTVTLAAGGLETLEIEPQDDQRVSQVIVPYLDRAANGSRRFQQQKAGSAETGHIMYLTASGEELDTFTPEEKLDSYAIQTADVSGSALKSWVMQRDSNVAAAAQMAGVAPAALPLGIGAASYSYQTTSSNNLPTTNKTIAVPATSFLNEQGQPVSTSGKKLLLTEDPPEWVKELYSLTPVTVAGTLAYEFKESDYSSGTQTNTYQVPDWWFSIPWSVTDDAGLRGTRTTYSGYQLFLNNFSLPGVLVNASFPGGTTIYKPATYTFIFPPAGFAAGLLAARNWTPYTGTISWSEAEAGAMTYLDKVINVSGADPAWASMRAMVQSEALDLDSGTTTLTLGPPQRHAFRSLIEQVKQSPNQQIVKL